MRRTLLALALISGLLRGTAALAQAPPPVPALPDAGRSISYNLNASTCACSVGFAIYGDSTDVDAWIEVYIDGNHFASTHPTKGWAITSVTGALATIPRPITNGVLTFNSAQTGVVTIVGSRRPRRAVQFAENRGVAARDLNQALTDIIAMLRETWDRTNDTSGRALLTPPGTGGMRTLPLATACVNSLLNFGSDGLTPTCSANGVPNSQLAQMQAKSVKMNPASNTALPVDQVISSLTSIGTPSATLDWLLIEDHLTNTIKKVSPSALTAAVGSGVTSLNSLAGALNIVAGGNITVSAAGSSVTVSGGAGTGSFTAGDFLVAAATNGTYQDGGAAPITTVTSGTAYSNSTGGAAAPGFGAFLALGNGSVSAPTYAFVGNAGTGIYRSAADNLDIAVTGVRTANFQKPSSTSYLEFLANSTPQVRAAGSGSNIGLYLASKGTGAIGLLTNNTQQVQIIDTVSAVNYLNLTGSATTAAVAIAAAGSDTNIPISIAGKGTGLALLGQTICTASGSTPQTCNGQRGVVTTGSLTTAHNASASYTVTNSSVTASSLVVCTIDAYSGTISTNGVPVITQCVPGSGSFVVNIFNADDTNAFSGTIGIGFAVLN